MSTEFDVRIGVTTPPAATPAATGVGGTDADRLQVRRLAEQFEAMLLTQMMREMRKSMLSGMEDEDKSNGFGAGALTDTMDVELGLALSRAGGFGLSSVLLGAFERLAGVGGTAGLSGSIPSADVPVDAPNLGSGIYTAATMAPGVASAIEAALTSTVPVGDVRDNLQSGRISSAFGWRNDPVNGSSRFHEGVDIAMPVGREVVAADRGRVAFSGEQSGFGNTILIEHGNGRQTRYAHLSEQIVRVGDEVEAGQVIGKSGATGRVTGPHLHFEVLVNGKAVNPIAHAGDLIRAKG